MARGRKVEVRGRLGQRVGDFIALDSSMTGHPEKNNIKTSLVKREKNGFDAYSIKGDRRVVK